MSTPGAGFGSRAAEKNAMSRLSAYTQLKENSSWFITWKKLFAEVTLFVSRSAKARALASSRPYVARSCEIATFVPPTVA